MWVGWRKIVSHGKVADERHTQTDRDRDTERMMFASLYWVLGAMCIVFHLEMVFWELPRTVLVEVESENFLEYETNKH